MQAGFLFSDFAQRHNRAFLPFKNKVVAQGSVLVFHFINMLFEEPCGDKVRQSGLFNYRNLAGVGAKFFFKISCKAGRKNKVADSEGWGERFRKSVHVKNFILRISTLQGWKRLTIKTELAVIIILNNITVTLLVRPRQQLHPAFYRNYNTGRKMVIRRNMNDFNILFP